MLSRDSALGVDDIPSLFATCCSSTFIFFHLYISSGERCLPRDESEISISSSFERCLLANMSVLAERLTMAWKFCSKRPVYFRLQIHCEHMKDILRRYFYVSQKEVRQLNQPSKLNEAGAVIESLTTQRQVPDHQPVTMTRLFQLYKYCSFKIWHSAAHRPQSALTLYLAIWHRLLWYPI